MKKVSIGLVTFLLSNTAITEAVTPVSLLKWPVQHPYKSVGGVLGTFFLAALFGGDDSDVPVIIEKSKIEIPELVKLLGLYWKETLAVSGVLLGVTWGGPKIVRYVRRTGDPRATRDQETNTEQNNVQRNHATDLEIGTGSDVHIALQDDLLQRIEQLTEQNRLAQQVIDEEKGTSQKLQNQIEQQTQALENLNRENTRIQGEAKQEQEKMKSALEALQNQIEQLKENNSQLGTQQQISENTIQQLNQIIKQLTQQKDDVQKELEDEQQKLCKEQEKSQGLQDQIAQNEAKIENLKKQNDVVQEDVQRKQKELRELTQKNSENKKQVEDLTKQLESQQIAKQQQQTEMQILQDKVEQLEGTKSQLTSQNNEMKQQIAQNGETIEKLKQEKINVQFEAEQREKDMQANLEDLQKKLQESEDQSADLQQTSEAEKRGLNQIIDQLKQQIEGVQRQLKDQAEQKEKAIATASEFQRKKDQMQEELEKKVEEFRKFQELSQQQLEEYERKDNPGVGEGDSFEDQVQELQKKINELEQANSTLQGQIDQWQGQAKTAADWSKMNPSELQKYVFLVSGVNKALVDNIDSEAKNYGGSFTPVLPKNMVGENSLQSFPFARIKVGCPDTIFFRGAFKGNEILSAVENGFEIKGVREEAFSGCINLREIDLSQTEFVGAFAFSNCNKLFRLSPNNSNKVDLSKMKYVGKKAFLNVFEDKDNISSGKLFDDKRWLDLSSVEKIESEAFSLRNPSKTGEGTFWRYGIDYVKLPADTLRRIENRAFAVNAFLPETQIQIGDQTVKETWETLVKRYAPKSQPQSSQSQTSRSDSSSDGKGKGRKIESIEDIDMSLFSDYLASEKKTKQPALNPTIIPVKNETPKNRTVSTSRSKNQNKPENQNPSKSELTMMFLPSCQNQIPQTPNEQIKTERQEETSQTPQPQKVRQINRGNTTPKIRFKPQ